MYTMNYMDNFVVKEKYVTLLVRILKLSNLFFHMLLIVLLLLSIGVRKNMNSYNSKIVNLKASIENKRSDNKIAEKEKKWDSYYYELLAIKEQLSKNTNYSFIVKELGTYFPKEDTLLSLNCEGDSLVIEVFLKESRMNDLKSLYDYSRILKESFEKSTYLSKEEIVVDSIKETSAVTEIKNKAGVILEVKIHITSRK